MTSQQSGQAPVTSNIQAFDAFQFTNPMAMPGDGKSYDLKTPDPSLSQVTSPTVSNPWESANLQFACDTLAAPDPTKGEDYLPVLNMSG
jgi:hypothetical protein